MKAGREHRVPLAAPVLELLKELRPRGAKQRSRVSRIQAGKPL